MSRVGDSGAGAAGSEVDSHSDLPLLLRLRPQVVVSNVIVVVVVAWLAVIAVDVLMIAGPRDWPLWASLFNDRFVEWLQWCLLGATIVAASYLSACLRERGDRVGAAFFLIMSLAAALMLIEDAGDVRHVLVRMFAGEGTTITPGVQLGVGHLIEMPYFLALAALPVYAVARYGRHVWAVRSVRPYLLSSFVLYAAAAGGSALSGIGGLYARIGAIIDQQLTGGRLLVSEEVERSDIHFNLVDSVIEESVETVAAACLLAMVLAYAATTLDSKSTDDSVARESGGGHVG